MNKHLNLFKPYENVAASHENQLTRALLVVLRYCPMAHQVWLHLVDARRQLHALPKPEFATQRQRILDEGAEVSEGEKIPGISVWLAPDAEQVRSRIESSDRQQVLDGIITYGSDLVVVIENKITWGGVTDQPHQLNLHGAPVVFEGEPVSIKWQELLGALAGLVEHDLVPGSERLLIGDFLDFVEEHFSHIGPYATLARCADQRFRLDRRLDAIIETVVGIEKGKGPGWRDLKGTQKIFMAKLALSDDGSQVCLQMYPADTLGQARAFFGDAESVAAVLSLEAEGWSFETNFHWGFMAPGYAWVKTPLPVEEYCAYWVREIAKTREVARGDWESYWAKLEADRIVEPAGKRGFDEHFTDSQRQKAQPRPGIACYYFWTLAEAKRLDARGKFVEQVRQRLNQMLAALNAPLVPQGCAGEAT